MWMIISNDDNRNYYKLCYSCLGVVIILLSFHHYHYHIDKYFNDIENIIKILKNNHFHYH